MLTAQVLVNGVLLGGLYACMAIGFSVIWGVMNIINLAHGSMIIMGAYVTYYLATGVGIDPFLTVPVAGAALFAFGFLVQRFLVNIVIEASVFMTMIMTFGLDMVIINANIALFTADIRSLSPSYAGTGFSVGGVRIAYTRLGVFAIAVALTIALMLFMNHTRTGNAIKATSFDLEAARLVGIDTRRIYAITFGVGAAMAGITGSLLAVVFSFSPVSGVALTMKSFVVVVLGGLGSIPGAIVGGIVLGVAENLTAIVLRPGYVNAVGFGLLMVILVLRPRGLFGKRFYAEI
jgi:branched-chain amino acid transport system permease protein